MPEEKKKPQLVEVGCSVSQGGKLQVKKYEISSDYHFHLSGKWAVPEDFTEDDAEQFRYEQILRLRKELEPVAQAEVDELLRQKDELS